MARGASKSTSQLTAFIMLTGMRGDDLVALATKHRDDPKMIAMIRAELKRRGSPMAARALQRVEAAIASPCTAGGSAPTASKPPEPNEVARLRADLSVLREGVSEVAEILARWGLTPCAPPAVEALAMKHWSEAAPSTPDQLGRSQGRLKADMQRLSLIRLSGQRAARNNSRHE
jgi:hypothetical protein